MTPKCFQTLDNGQRCPVPAIEGSKFCRHHDAQRQPKQTRESRENEPLTLPPLVDKPSILAALNVVLAALAEGRIKRSVADTLLSGIKLANRLITEIAESAATVFPANGYLQHSRPHKAVASLAATREPRKATQAFSLSDQPTDRFVEEMMAQAHELLAASPKPDPRFVRS